MKYFSEIVDWGKDALFFLEDEEANFIIYQKLAEKYNLRNITMDELGHLKKMNARDVMAYVELKKRPIYIIKDEVSSGKEN